MSGGSTDRTALEAMLKGYSLDQVVEEVLVAWDELTRRNEELADSKQRTRVLELDLAERKDSVAPEVSRLSKVEDELRKKEAKVDHLEGVLEDARQRLELQESVLSEAERDRLLDENADLSSTIEQQVEVITEMEGKLDEMIAALQKAANVGLTSITAEEFQAMRDTVRDAEMQFEAERAAVVALEEERIRLREIVERLRGLLDQRDKRLLEMEEQMESMMRGPKSISAEHDYLIEQIEELKRRLVERNREYESLRRRERRMHNDVFERDERIQQMQLTMVDLEGGLQDRTSELRALEGVQEQTEGELHAAMRTERTREVVGKVFADSLELSKDRGRRADIKQRQEQEGLVERILETPDLEDMKTLAGGEGIDLELTEKEIEDSGVDSEKRPSGPGGSAVPAVEDEKPRKKSKRKSKKK